MEQKQEKEQQSVGAMWSKVGHNQNQTRYYTISIDTKSLMDDEGNIPEKINLIAFRNFFKSRDNQPDYKIYIREKREDTNEIPF